MKRLQLIQYNKVDVIIPFNQTDAKEQGNQCESFVWKPAPTDATQQTGFLTHPRGLFYLWGLFHKAAAGESVWVTWRH